MAKKKNVFGQKLIDLIVAELAGTEKKAAEWLQGEGFGTVENALCTDLMNYDRSNYPKFVTTEQEVWNEKTQDYDYKDVKISREKVFKGWAEGNGMCPYTDYGVDVTPLAFTPSEHLYNPRKKTPTAKQLARRIIEEKLTYFSAVDVLANLS